MNFFKKTQRGTNLLNINANISTPYYQTGDYSMFEKIYSQVKVCTKKSYIYFIIGHISRRFINL